MVTAALGPIENGSTKVVDLRSDTVTKPTQAMRAAMAAAEVDDDVLGADPTAQHFLIDMAKLMGKEAALFVPSGTMANLISVLVHCDVFGSEVILGDNSHINIYENGGISTLGSVHSRTVHNNPDGTMDLALIEAAIRPTHDDLYYPTTRLICLENTHANCGGKCISVDYTDKVGEIAKKHGLKLHIDGARIPLRSNPLTHRCELVACDCELHLLAILKDVSMSMSDPHEQLVGHLRESPEGVPLTGRSALREFLF